MIDVRFLIFNSNISHQFCLHFCFLQFIECLPNFSSGHVFAFGESRALAIANMVLGLKEIQIRGEIRTNVDYTIDLLHVNFSPIDNSFLLMFLSSQNLIKEMLQKKSKLTEIEMLYRLQITEIIKSTQVGWTVGLRCGLEQRDPHGISLLLEGLCM